MKKNKPFLVVDTETGGLDCNEHSLLSIAGVAWDVDSGVTPLFSFYVKESGIVATKQALNVNKIDLKEVRNTGLVPREAVSRIRGALDAHFGAHRSPIQLVAHNAPFDLGFIRRLYRRAQEEFSEDFRDRALDTCSILQFLIMTGAAEGYRASADVLFKTAGVSIPENERHTALGDAMATAESMHIILNKLRSENND